MQEIKLKEDLYNGLRISSTRPVDSVSLVECFNLKPYKDGFRVNEAFDQPPLTWSNEPIHEIPYPLVRAKRDGGYFVENNSRLYVANSTLEVQDITWYDLDMPIVPYTEAWTGGYWHYADFGTFWWATNGSMVACYSPKLSKYLVSHYYKINTCCAFKGRLLVAGFNSDADSHSSLIKSSLLSTALTDSSLDDQFSPMPALTANTVAWSPIGGGACFDIPGLGIERGELSNGFASHSGVTGTSLRGYFYDMVLRQDSGNMVLAADTIYQLIPTEDAVYALTSHGLFELFHVVEPISTFGYRHRARLPFRNRCAGVAARDYVVSINSNGVVCRCTRQELVTTDYSEFLSQLAVDNTLTLCYDPMLDEVYLSTSGAGFVLTQDGLAQIGALVTGIIDHSGAKYVAHTYLDGYYETYSLKTAFSNFGVNSYKVLKHVRVMYDSATIPLVKVYFKTSRYGEEFNTGWIKCDGNGMAFVNCPGFYFAIEVCLGATDVGKIDCLELGLSTSAANLNLLK